MNQNKKAGYIKSETVIWYVAASLLIGFISGVAFGIYKSASLSGAQQPGASVAMDERLQESVRLLKERTEKNPADSQAWIQLGHIYFDANQVAEAIVAYERALELVPNNANVWTDLGVMYRRSDQPQRAVAAFDKAMSLDAAHEASRFNKGIVLLHDLKDAPGALAAWESLLAINPDATGPNGQTVRSIMEHTRQAHLNPS